MRTKSTENQRKRKTARQQEKRPGKSSQEYKKGDAQGRDDRKMRERTARVCARGVGGGAATGRGKEAETASDPFEPFWVFLFWAGDAEVAGTMGRKSSRGNDRGALRRRRGVRRAGREPSSSLGEFALELSRVERLRDGDAPRKKGVRSVQSSMPHRQVRRHERETHLEQLERAEEVFRHRHDAAKVVKLAAVVPTRHQHPKVSVRSGGLGPKSGDPGSGAKGGSYGAEKMVTRVRSFQNS